jgi:hypothetical protein
LFDSLKLSSTFGAAIDVNYNIGRGMGINQLFFGIGAGFGFGDAQGTYNAPIGNHPKFGSFMCLNFEAFLMKKFYIGRLALMLKPAFGYQGISLATAKDDDNPEYRFSNGALGFAASGGLEYALNASMNIGVGAGYQLYGTSKDWTRESKSGDNWEGKTDFKNDFGVKHTGLIAQIYFSWSVPGLPFDPMDMVRASSGL